MDPRRRLTDGRDVLGAAHLDRRDEGGRVSAALSEHRGEVPISLTVELDGGDIDDLCRVGIQFGRLRFVLGLDLEALDPSRERADCLAPVAGRRVDRDLGVAHLLAGDGEDAEAEAVLAPLVDRGGGAHHQVGLLGAGGLENLCEGPAAGRGKVRGRRSRSARWLPAAAVPAAACGGAQRERSERGGHEAGPGHRSESGCAGSSDGAGCAPVTVLGHPRILWMRPNPHVSNRPVGSRSRRRREEIGLADRAALVTGGSSGIGLAIARALGEDGYGVTISARRPEKLDAAAEELRGAGIDVHSTPANMAGEEAVAGVVEAHRERFGRLDVLVNNAGVGIGEPMAEISTKFLDMQLGVNLRAVVVATREALPMLREAGAEHGKALIVNTGLDRRQDGPGVAIGLLGDQSGSGRFQPGDAEGGRRPRDSGDGVLSRVRRYADDRVRQGTGEARGDDPARGHRRVGALPAQDVAGVPGAGDRLHSARRAAGRLSAAERCSASCSSAAASRSRYSS